MAARLQDANRSGAVQADGLGRAEAQVEADPAHERPAVIDEHVDGFSGAGIGHVEADGEGALAAVRGHAAGPGLRAARGGMVPPLIRGPHPPALLADLYCLPPLLEVAGPPGRADAAA